jgi:O-antigen/teichoic acid export membrane protein
MLTSFSAFLYKIFERFFDSKFSKEGFIIYMRSIQWTSISRVFTLVFSLITTMIVARHLGPETFGTLSYIISLVGIFGVLANLGIDNIVFREIVLHKEKRDEILGSALILKLLTGLITICIILVSLLFINETLHTELLIFILSLSFITQPLTLFSFDFLKDNESKYVTVTQVITLFISNGLKIASVFFYSSLLLFIIILILENIIAGIIYVYQIKKIKHRSLNLKVTKKQLFFILTLALPLTLFSAFSEIYARIDQIMLKHYLDGTSVGLYAAAARLTELWHVLPNILFAALFPALANSALQSNSEYKKRFKIFSTVLIISSTIISVLVFFTSNFIVRTIYGEDFIEAGSILAIYIFSLPGSFISGLIYQDLIIKNKIWLITILPGSTMIINIALNIYLIPLMGTTGAAIATVISYNLVPILYFLFRKKKVSESQQADDYKPL